MCFGFIPLVGFGRLLGAINSLSDFCHFPVSNSEPMDTKLTAMALVALMVCAADAYPCKTSRRVSSVDMVLEADAIARVTAEGYTVAPRVSTSPMGRLDVQRIRFKVLEVIRGKVPADLFLDGVLVDADDFNDETSPYNSVRSEGKRGSCFAGSYRTGAQFLLLLKKRGSDFTVDWYPLAPVNEQLRSVNDPWLLWVRTQANAPIGKSPARQ